MKKNKKVQLVLGSGGARGIAHIAVIEELEKRGYEIIEIVGCSMGAVIGGIYAAGHLTEYKEWLFNLDKSGVFDLMDFTFTRQGFVKGEKIFAKHKEMTGDLSFDDLKIPFTAVATDMRNREEVHFKSGDLYKALRASVSIPGLYVPVVYENRVLVDGGVLNPLPINLVQRKRGTLLVAVDLNAPAVEGCEIEPEEPKKPSWFDQMLPENLKFPDIKWPLGNGDPEPQQEEIKKEEELKEVSYSLLELMENTFSFTQDRLTSMIVKTYEPDVLINIPRNTCKTFDFFKAKGIYEAGKAAFERDFDW